LQNVYKNLKYAAVLVKIQRFSPVRICFMNVELTPEQLGKYTPALEFYKF